MGAVGRGRPIARRRPQKRGWSAVAGGEDHEAAAPCEADRIERGTDMQATLARHRLVMLSILRVMTALPFLERGLTKLLQFRVPQPGAPRPSPAPLLAAAAIETVVDRCSSSGPLTRVVAFVTAGRMAVADFVAHAPQGFWPGANGAMPPSCSASSSSPWASRGGGGAGRSASAPCAAAQDRRGAARRGRRCRKGGSPAGARDRAPTACRTSRLQADMARDIFRIDDRRRSRR